MYICARLLIMERKKNQKVDLEKFRGLFFTTAMVMVLTAMLWVLNYKQPSHIDQKIYAAASSREITQFEQEIGKAVKSRPENTPDKIKQVEDEQKIADTARTEIPDENAGTQNNNTGKSSNTPLYSAEIMPVYPGGTTALRQDLAKQIQLPPAVKNGKIAGTLYVQFVITKDGFTDDIQIKQSLHRKLDQEVMKALKNIKKFTPALQNGRPVAVYFILPLSFNKQ